MADAACQHENMPDSVIKKVASAGIEENPGGIENSSCYKENQTSCRKAFNQGLYRADNKPTHKQIKDSWNNSQAFDKKSFKHHPGYGQAPDNTKERPSQGSAEGYQGKWGIGACY